MLSADPSVATPVASFPAGESPIGPVVFDAAGDMFGVVAGGGGADEHVYEVAAESATIANIATLTSVNQSRPTGRLTIDSVGNLFAVSPSGGTNGDGMIYKIAAGSHAVTTYSFDGSNGSQPDEQLAVDASDNIFGAASLGGQFGLGAVFEIAHGSDALTPIVSFDGINGGRPFGIVLGPGGNLYGADSALSAPTFFEVAHGSHTISTPLAKSPYRDLYFGAGSEITMDASGNIFGATDPYTPVIGPHNETAPATASLFALNLDGRASSFDYEVDNNPILTPFLLDAHGNLVGSTAGGSVFVWSKGFGQDNYNVIGGEAGSVGVALAPGGDLIQATSLGGTNDSGEIVRITHDSVPPAAVISAPNISLVGGQTFNITVDYHDNLALNVALAGAKGSINVAGPDGRPLAVLSTSGKPFPIDYANDNQDESVTYTVAAPHGQWTAADNGKYTVSIPPDAVSDIWGNPASASATFSFVYPPTTEIYAPDVAMPGGTVEPVTVVYHGNGSPIDPRSLGAANITVSNEAGTALAVGQPTFTADGNDLTATYPVTPPGGLWSLEDQGNYSVGVVGGSVASRAGGVVAAGVGSFIFNIAEDPSFGAIIPGGQTRMGVVSPGFHTTDVIPEPDGSVLVAGYRSDGDVDVSLRGVIERLTPDGAIDPTFNGGNAVLTPPPDSNNSNFDFFTTAAVQSDGKIVVFGGAYDGTSLLVARLNADGSPDSGFANAGFEIINLDSVPSFSTVGPYQAPTAATVESNGDILVAGGGFFIRFSASGAIVNRSSGSLPPLPTQLVPLPDGKVLDVSFNFSGVDGVALTRLKADGTIDSTFNGGTVVTPLNGNPPNQAFASAPWYDAATTMPGVALQPDGQILVSGPAPGGGLGAVRLNADGHLDLAFGVNGLAVATFNAATDVGDRISVNGATGQFVLIGNTFSTANDVGEFSIVVAAFNSDGTPDVAFGSAGTVELPAPAPAPNPSAVNAAVYPANGGPNAAPEIFGGFEADGAVLVGASQDNSTGIRRLQAFSIEHAPPVPPGSPPAQPPASSPSLTTPAPVTPQLSIVPSTNADATALPVDAQTLEQIDSGDRQGVELDMKHMRRMMGGRLSKAVRSELKRTLVAARQFLVRPKNLLHQAASELRHHDFMAARQTLSVVAAIPDLSTGDEARLVKEQAALADN
jgi:uncharacterized delta-60 repeat protein